jgi:hypothetical protein
MPTDILTYCINHFRCVSTPQDGFAHSYLVFAPLAGPFGPLVRMNSPSSSTIGIPSG